MMIESAAELLAVAKWLAWLIIVRHVLARVSWKRSLCLGCPAVIYNVVRIYHYHCNPYSDTVIFIIVISSLHTSFSGSFRAQRWLTGSLLFFPLLPEENLQSVTGFLWARCPSSHWTNSVKALKETQSTDPSQVKSSLASSFLHPPLDS